MRKSERQELDELVVELIASYAARRDGVAILGEVDDAVCRTLDRRVQPPTLRRSADRLVASGRLVETSPHHLAPVPGPDGSDLAARGDARRRELGEGIIAEIAHIASEVASRSSAIAGAVRDAPPAAFQEGLSYSQAMTAASSRIQDLAFQYQLIVGRSPV